jgi:threonine/homoserine/homoserine lactone efflux protein
VLGVHDLPLFFVAFLPQLVDAGTATPVLAFVFPGTPFNVGSLAVNLPVSWLAARAGQRARASASRWLRAAPGSLFVLLAVRLAMLERR